MNVEHVFKAVADHHRRHLLDLLAQTDGQTLTELCAHLPMSRIGVMKHLRILQEAGLIQTRKVGRERHHYLNRAPIQAIADWADQYRQFREESFDRLEELLQAMPPPATSPPATSPHATSPTTLPDDDSPDCDHPRRNEQ